MGGRDPKTQRGMQWILGLAALVMLVALLRSWRSGRSGEELAPGAPLKKGEGASVAAFTLSHGGDTLRAVRDQGGWRLTRPVADRGSARMVREMFRNLEELPVIRVLETAERAAYGLDPPRSLLTLERAAGGRLQIAIGDAVPSAATHYAIWDGLDAVALVPSFVVNRFFLCESFQWRERELIEPGGPVDSVWVAAAGTTCRARRTGRESWELTSPKDREANALTLERATGALWRYPLLGFYDDLSRPADFGLDPPQAVWTLFRGTAVDTLRIGLRLESGEMIVQASGRPPGRISGELYDLLVGGLSVLESRPFLRGSPQEVDCFLVATPAGGRLHVKRAGRWRQAALTARAAAGLEGQAHPDTSASGREFASAPGAAGDLANLFELRGSEAAGSAGASARAEDYVLRIHLWGPGNFHEWLRCAPGGRGAAEPEASPGGEAGAASGPRLVGTAIGSRFPGRPMAVDSDLLWRLALQGGLSREVLDHLD